MSIVDSAKSALDIARAIDNIPLQRDILELQAQALELLEARAGLQDRIAELETQLQRRTAMFLKDRGNLYYVVGEDGIERGPLCPECYQSTGFIYILSGDTPLIRRCSVCRKAYHR
jgi:hypothetical protein